nr:MAG TPA: membrane protein [Caudoviricetes sp.]
MRPYKYSCKDWVEQKLTKEVQDTRILCGVHALFILLWLCWAAYFAKSFV